MEDIFAKSNELLKEVIYKKIEEYSTFLHIKSVFTDAWYNYIVPVGPFSNFDWGKAEKIITAEMKNGVDISYYIKGSLLKEYKPQLTKKALKEFGDDTFMVLRMKNKFRDVAGEFDEVDDKNFDKYISMAEECFPDWSAERKYCKHFYQLARNNKDKDKLFSSLLLKENGEYVSFASVYGSKKLNLAYFHNAGTLPKHRKKGYHSTLVKKRCNWVNDLGVKTIYSIVEGDGGSYHGLSKLGFKPAAKFFLFIK